jgi:hypothetical protein
MKFQRLHSILLVVGVLCFLSSDCTSSSTSTTSSLNENGDYVIGDTIPNQNPNLSRLEERGNHRIVEHAASSAFVESNNQSGFKQVIKGRESNSGINRRTSMRKGPETDSLSQFVSISDSWNSHRILEKNTSKNKTGTRGKETNKTKNKGQSDATSEGRIESKSNGKKKRKKKRQTQNSSDENSEMMNVDESEQSSPESDEGGKSRNSPRYPPDLCLRSQKDSYRTCFQRHIDPTSHYTTKCDMIDREFASQKKEYNPYTKPYTADDEELIKGSLVLTFLQDDSTDELNCRTSFKMEETLLTYLSDNIGSDDTFTPMCVYLESYAYSRSSCTKEISLAMEFEVTFVQKMKNDGYGNDHRRLNVFELRDGLMPPKLLLEPKEKIAGVTSNTKSVEIANEMEETNRAQRKVIKRRKKMKRAKETIAREIDKNGQCSDILTALCCSQLAINSSADRLGRPQDTPPGLFCDSVGCSFREKCGTGRSTSKYLNRFLRRNGEDNSKNIVGGGGRKDCLPYSYPNANPTWFENYEGRGDNNNEGDKYDCPAYGILKSQDFNEAVRCIAKLRPEDSSNYADAFHGSTENRIKSAPVYAQLNIRSVESAAYCSLNRYNLQQQEWPSLTCDEFENEYECQASEKGINVFGTNDDILPFVDTITEDGKVCLDPDDIR